MSYNFNFYSFQWIKHPQAKRNRDNLENYTCTRHARESHRHVLCDHPLWPINASKRNYDMSLILTIDKNRKCVESTLLTMCWFDLKSRGKSSFAVVKTI